MQGGEFRFHKLSKVRRSQYTDGNPTQGVKEMVLVIQNVVLSPLTQ